MMKNKGHTGQGDLSGGLYQLRFTLAHDRAHNPVTNLLLASEFDLDDAHVNESEGGHERAKTAGVGWLPIQALWRLAEADALLSYLAHCLQPGESQRDHAPLDVDPLTHSSIDSGGAGGLLDAGSLDSLDSLASQDSLNSPDLLDDMFALLAGRALLPGEIICALEAGGRSTRGRETDDLATLMAHYAPLVIPAVIGKDHPRHDWLLALSGIEPDFSLDLAGLQAKAAHFSRFRHFFRGASASLRASSPGRCLRCGAFTVEAWACVRCESRCYSCRACYSAGEATSCTPLFIFPSQDPRALQNPQNQQKPQEPQDKQKPQYPQNPQEQRNLQNERTDANSVTNRARERHTVSLAFELTRAQQAAYAAARAFVEADHPSAPAASLIHAVCGAGKTEAVFGAILSVLNRGGRVLYTTPRRDLVREQAHRFRQAFPRTKHLTLYGQSPEKYADAHLVLATTHQTMRFYRAFDLVILDEVDAFPYQGSDRLPQLVQRAKTARGKFIYISATPDKKLLRQAQQGTRTALITIPARYHGHPAPEPQLVKSAHQWVFGARSGAAGLSFRGRNHSLPGEVADFFARHGGSKPILVFVPTVKLVAQVEERLKVLIGGVRHTANAARPNSSELPLRIAGISSRSSHRDHIREAIDRGEIDILVTTTILERGITLPGVQVLVLFAHHEIFDHRTLVQIAGRVGRTASDPVGEVRFIADRVTGEMKAARDMIQHLNREAARQGFIN